MTDTPARRDPEFGQMVELSAALYAIRSAVDAKIAKVDREIAEARVNSTAKTERGRFGSITFARRADKVTVVDAEAMLDWLLDNAPEAVVESASTKFLSGLHVNADGEPATGDGDVIDWAEAVVEVTDHDGMLAWMEKHDAEDEIVASPAPGHEKVVQARLDQLGDDVVDNRTGDVIDWATVTPGTAYVTHRPDESVLTEATDAIETRVSDFARGLAEQAALTAGTDTEADDPKQAKPKPPRTAKADTGTTRKSRRRRRVDDDDD